MAEEKVIKAKKAKTKKEPKERFIKDAIDEKDSEGKVIGKILIAQHNGEEYQFVYRDNKIFCLSAKLLDEETFKKHERQLHAVFRKYQEMQNSASKNNDTDKLKPQPIWSEYEDERTRLKNLKIFGCHVLKNGELLINYKHDGKIKSAAYEDINSAIRAQGHISKGYLDASNENSEIARLFSKIGSIDEIRQVLFDWKKKTPSEIKNANDILNRLTINLQRCRDELKKEALKQLESSVDFTDSIGRPNPGSSLARTFVAENRLEKRISKSNAIDNHARRRKNVLELELKQMQLNIFEANFILKTVLNSSNKFFEDREGADKKLGQALNRLQSVWLNPYLEKIHEIQKDILEAKFKISKNEIARARTFIAGAISKLSCIQ